MQGFSPAKSQLRRSLRVAQLQGPPGLSTIGNAQTAMACLQPARMIARAAYRGTAAVDPTIWRRKALSELCLLAFGDNGGEFALGFIGRDLHTCVRGRRNEVTPTTLHSTYFPCILLLRMAAVWPFDKSCHATHNNGSAEEGAAVSKPSLLTPSDLFCRRDLCGHALAVIYRLRPHHTQRRRQHCYNALNPSNLCRSKPN